MARCHADSAVPQVDLYKLRARTFQHRQRRVHPASTGSFCSEVAAASAEKDPRMHGVHDGLTVRLKSSRRRKHNRWANDLIGHVTRVPWAYTTAS